ncbi:MAG: biotin/lipoyl-containing protein [Syntrophomonadaceae bacterium]|jgi:biotin carboxyl carrier protein
MKYIVTINDKSYEVEVEHGQASIVKTTPAAVPAPAVEPAAITPEKSAQPTGTSTTPNKAITGEPVKAPMPGTIMAVQVRPGDAVQKGAVLVILEAMKMENEIHAPADGIVSQIMVDKGASVSTGDILLTLE